MDRELKCLNKVSADHEKALRRAVEKAVADYPNSEKGRNFLEAYWASKIDEYKKSDDFQKKVAQVAFPFVGYGFNACKEQFLTHRPPPAGEEISFLDMQLAYDNAPNPFASPSALEEENPPQDSGRSVCLLPPWRGSSGSETSPPAAATDFPDGEVSGEGKPEGKKENTPTDPLEGLSNDPPAPTAVPAGTPLSSSGPQDPEDPACGEKI
ncbi:UNVERIFIED_CONTAM: hypothetical protein Slati_0199100 [Sesamum latifolium]|uniref:Uncharacterized protein n=1 Tax=Sesamum latifolium TaxID=2727402 RepID=A0AAW2YBN6_9LAMI